MVFYTFSWLWHDCGSSCPDSHCIIIGIFIHDPSNRVSCGIKFSKERKFRNSTILNDSKGTGNGSIIIVNCIHLLISAVSDCQNSASAVLVLTSHGGLPGMHRKIAIHYSWGPTQVAWQCPPNLGEFGSMLPPPPPRKVLI